MIDNFNYKQQLLIEYLDLFNKYQMHNASSSLNCRFIHLSPESNYDNIGGAVENWSSKLTQLKWDVYENVPLFQNAPATTSVDEYFQANQSTSVTIKFIDIEPLPNDMIMFYDDSSVTVYKIDNITFHKTIQHNNEIFGCDISTAPVDSETVFNNLNILQHKYFDQYNNKLFDYLDWMDNYQPILDSLEQIRQDLNNYYDFRNETYSYFELNDIIKYIVQNSFYKSILATYNIPFGDYSQAPSIQENPDASTLYEKLIKLKEILC